MHLSVVIGGGGGGGGGVITYSDGGIGLFLYFRSRIPRGRPMGFVAPPPFYNWSCKRMPFLSAKGLGLLVNMFWQNGDRKDGK